MSKKLLLLMAIFCACKQRTDTSLQRGDEVQIIDCFESSCWYQQCKKMTYLAGQALDNENAVWLLAEGCPWYQYPDMNPPMITTKNVVTMRLRDIQRKSNE